jgi:hypothetical protein
MQAQPSLARFSHCDFNGNPDLWDHAGNGTQPVPDIEYYLTVPSETSGSGNWLGSGDGLADTTSTSSAGSASPFVINIAWDSSVGSAPAGFTTAVMKAVQFLESQFANQCTITIDVGYGEAMGNALGAGVLGESLTYLNEVSYSSLASALKARDPGAVAPTNPGGTIWASTADMKALGLSSGASIDGYVGFSSQYPFTYDNTNGVAAGTYDFYGTAVHEMTEVMGRMMLDGGTIGGISNSYCPLDLYHYSAPGVPDFSSSTPGYLSANGGVTDSGDLNTGGGDPGDWASSMGNDSFDAIANSGVMNAVSQDDITAMNLLGWEPAGSAPPPPPLPPPPPPNETIVCTPGESVNVLQLVQGLGGSSASPTFVDASSNDTINATGMTAQVSFVFGLTADTSDVISGFAQADVIDLTALGTLSYDGKLPATITTGGHGKHANTTNQVLPAHSFGWQTSGGNTFVYVNTGSSAVAVGAANMKIELQGNVALSSGNFLHH